VTGCTGALVGEADLGARNRAGAVAALDPSPPRRPRKVLREVGQLKPRPESLQARVAMSLPAHVKKLCFERSGYIYVLSSEDRQLTRVVEGGLPNLSPAGKVVAFGDEGGRHSDPRKIKLADLKAMRIYGLYYENPVCEPS